MTKRELLELSKEVRISLENFDEESLLSEFNEIQDFITNIERIDIPNDTVFFEHPLVPTVKLRADVVEESFDVPLILKNAPEADAGNIVVPKVL